MKRLLLLLAAVGVATLWAAWPDAVLSHDTESTTTTVFDREIVRILNTHCVSCHAKGSLSFPLTTYEETYVRARSIKQQALRRHMPPWSAVRGYGHFANDNSLTAREIDFLVSWADGGRPRNAGTVFLNVQESKSSSGAVSGAGTDSGWQSGAPDVTLDLPPTSVAARDTSVSRTIVDLGLGSDRWLTGVEYVPKDRRVVTAAFFTIEGSGQWIGSWTPWHRAHHLPPGKAYRLPAGSRLVAEIHYKGADAAAEGGGTAGLFLGDRPADSCGADLHMTGVIQNNSGAPGRKYRAETRTEADTHVVGLRPEVVPGMRSIEVSAMSQDGSIRILLFAKDFQVDWPTSYLFKEPVLLEAGTRLSVVAYVDDGTAPHPMGLTVSRCSVGARVASLDAAPTMGPTLAR